MKPQYCILTLTLIVASMLMTGCEIETSNNGKLDGFWHLTSIDTIATSTSCDLSQKHRFWGVNFNLMRLQDFPEDEAGSFFLRFDKSGDSLRVYEPRTGSAGASAGETLDTLLTSPLPLSPYGIRKLDTMYYIEKLNSSRMVLNDGMLRLMFTKM